MAESASELVARYRRLSSGDRRAPDAEDLAPEILSRLDDFANEPEAASLLLDVLRDRAEPDLARIEAAKIVWLFVEPSCPAYEDLASAMWAVLRDRTDDPLVRQHIAQNLVPSGSTEDEIGFLRQLLLDDSEDLDVRHNALTYAESLPSSPQKSSLFDELAAHPYWSRYSLKSG